MNEPAGQTQMRNAPANRPEDRLFSIGHSHHTLAEFLALLERAEIGVVADVRSQPYSQRMPQFNRPELELALQSAGVGYQFLGGALGGRPQQPSLYDADGRVDYERVRRMDFFERGLEQLIQAREQRRVVMLCAEEDPLDCHRGLMITPALASRHIFPMHLRGDGTRETTREMEERLLELTNLGGLFALTAEDRASSLVEAYRAWARKKAYRLKDADGGD
jgi:uncharacterized protein (DUF488 family)